MLKFHLQEVHVVAI